MSLRLWLTILFLTGFACGVARAFWAWLKKGRKQ